MSSETGDRFVMCVPGFPASSDDPDKPFLFNHTQALLSAGFDVTVICPAVPGLPSREIIEGVEVVRARYAPRRMETLATTGSMYREARGLKALLVLPMLLSMIVTSVRQLRRGPSCAYGHWWVPGGLVAVVAARCSNRPSIVHVHGSDAVIAKTPTMRKLARVVLGAADVRLVVSEELKQWVTVTSGKPAEVVPMPLAFDRLPQPSPVPTTGCTLGVGRLVHEKGFDLLIDAMGMLNVDERTELVIVGSGPDRHALADRAAKAQVSLHLPGAVPPTELVKWYRRALIVVVPSRREGFGLVAAEAAATGRAVVGTKVGALPTLIKHGQSGLLIEPDDAQALATALREVDPRWGGNGPEMVGHLGLERHGALLRQVYDDLNP